MSVRTNAPLRGTPLRGPVMYCAALRASPGFACGASDGGPARRPSASRQGYLTTTEAGWRA